MGILKETGETLVKFGEIIVNKAEELAKIGKLNVDIKRLQLDMGIAEKELGRHIISRIDGGASSIDAGDAKVKDYHERVINVKKKIDEKKAEIDKVKTDARMKAESKSDNKPQGGTQQ
jgi:hypothetical protein